MLPIRQQFLEKQAGTTTQLRSIPLSPGQKVLGTRHTSSFCKAAWQHGMEKGGGGGMETMRLPPFHASSTHQKPSPF